MFDKMPKVLIVIIGMVLLGLMRFYWSNSRVEPYLEKAVEAVVESQTGVSVLNPPNKLA